MHINAILAYQFISEYPVKSYKIALFVIKYWSVVWTNQFSWANPSHGVVYD